VSPRSRTSSPAGASPAPPPAKATRPHARPLTQSQLVRMLLKLAAKPVAADSTPVVELERGAREQILIRVRTTGKSTKEELDHASKLAQDELDALMAKYPPLAPANGNGA